MALRFVAFTNKLDVVPVPAAFLDVQLEVLLFTSTLPVLLTRACMNLTTLVPPITILSEVRYTSTSMRGFLGLGGGCVSVASASVPRAEGGATWPWVRRRADQAALAGDAERGGSP
eukprot:CAMPEP_0114262490 /NCGR_PEP_ID=MMETSP0058-20121206/21840_1 /TAXON_ID=36894 /ORGANISM="Pyramimonas parkeae, CCMP726" /LENGTH=115 /DNA_ID=CAMNT_0001378379 /DNA_START=189 /DNA_END=534 /DNA_ORIENTATION=+